MGKNKRARFAENATFDSLLQPSFASYFQKEHPLKGQWNEQFPQPPHPITLELGCGRGEYTLALAQRNPQRNFIGMDIKGARIWYGAKKVHTEQILNVRFLRARIEFLSAFFAPEEIDQIWITFPDPQLKERREKKRLTAPYFLQMYKTLLRPQGLVHLKTDSQELYQYTLSVLQEMQADIRVSLPDIDPYLAQYPELAIKTHYEAHFREQGKPITYIRFSL